MAHQLLPTIHPGAARGDSLLCLAACSSKEARVASRVFFSTEWPADDESGKQRGVQYGSGTQRFALADYAFGNLKKAGLAVIGYASVQVAACLNNMILKIEVPDQLDLDSFKDKTHGSRFARLKRKLHGFSGNSAQRSATLFQHPGTLLCVTR